MLGTVRSVFDGFEKVFLLNHATPTEASEALMAVTAMRTASVKHIVYLSVHHTEKAAWLPHFGTKVAVEEALKVSGIPYTILRPNNFFQNDYWFKDAILDTVSIRSRSVRPVSPASTYAISPRRPQSR